MSRVENKKPQETSGGKLTDAELVELLTEQLNNEREQRISNLKNAVSILRACTMGLETILRKAVDPELHRDTECMLGLILTMRSIMEDEVTLEEAKASAVNSINGLEAVH